MQRALYSEKRRRGEGPASRPHLVAHHHVELLVAEEEHIERQEDHAHVGADSSATAAPAQAARQPIPSAADRQVAAFREAVARVVVCRPDLHATPSRLQCQRRVQDQALGTPHAQGLDSVKDSVIHKKRDEGSVRFTQQLTKSPVARFLQACGGTTQASLEPARTLPAGFGAGPDPVSPAAGPLRAASLSSALLQPPVTLQFAACLVRPPVARTWAPQDALPVKQWPPGRRVPPSGRGKMPAAEQGAQAARPQQALGGCGDSTRKIRLASKLVLFQYWL